MPAAYPSVFAELHPDGEFNKNISAISSSIVEINDLGDVPKGFQFVSLTGSLFSGSQFTYIDGTNSAIVFNSFSNSSNVFYSFNAIPTGSFAFELKIGQYLELNSLEQIKALKLYTSGSATINVEFFS